VYSREYSHIGKVQYVFNIRAKRIILKVKSDASVWVTLPPFSELQKAESFLLSRSAWVTNAQDKVRKKSLMVSHYEHNASFTHFHTIQFFEQNVNAVSGRINKNCVTINLPIGMSQDSDECRAIVRTMYMRALQLDARTYLPKRLKELAQAHDFSYVSIRITSAKTRWGSCSARNTINFTWYIMKLPLHLIDFIILHELCHTVHKNHGQKFHNLLNACCSGKEAQYSKELRMFTIS